MKWWSPLNALIITITLTTLFPHILSQNEDTSEALSACSSAISITDFEEILDTDSATEYGLSDEFDMSTVESIWKDVAQYDWNEARLSHERAVEDGNVGFSTFIVCSSYDGSSLERKNRILELIGIQGIEGGRLLQGNRALDEVEITTDNFDTIHNTVEKTCYSFRMTFDQASQLCLLGRVNDVVLHPMSHAMKLGQGLVSDFLTRINSNSNGGNNSGMGEEQGVNSTEVATEDLDDIEKIVNLMGLGLDVRLCKIVTQAEMSNLKENIMNFLKGRSADGKTSLVGEHSTFKNVTCDDLVSEENIPSRAVYWCNIIEKGLNQQGECDYLLDRLTFDLDQNETSGEIHGYSVGLGPAPDNTTKELNSTVACGLSVVAGLTRLSYVCGIQLRKETETSNGDAQWITQGGQTSAGQEPTRPFWDSGLDGKGQVVTVSDSGVDTDNCYFWDSQEPLFKDGSLNVNHRKIVQYYPFRDGFDMDEGHGTHVAGTAVGSRSVNGEEESLGAADGMAKGAKLAFIDCNFNGVDNAAAILTPPASFNMRIGWEAGSRIHSASWGSGVGSVYEGLAASYDSFLSDNWDALLIVAAGNSGPGDRTINSPGTSKNALTVGATQTSNPDELASFSSRGPTRDSRIKPDVVAPGAPIESARSNPFQVGECDDSVNSGLTFMQGTSMATPAVAGSAAIVRQYFMEGWFPDGVKKDDARPAETPSGALVKAILINGAREITSIQRSNQRTAYYDGNQGFGRISLADSLPLPGTNTFKAIVVDREKLSDREVFEKKIAVQPSDDDDCVETELRVTLVWPDPPGAPGCTKCLVNDLDLTVQDDSTGTVFYPNGRNGKDSRNNVERVITDMNRDAGSYTINIRAPNLDRNGQVFAVYITGCIDGNVTVGDEQPTSSAFSVSGVLFFVLTCAFVSSLFQMWCW